MIGRMGGFRRAFNCGMAGALLFALLALASGCSSPADTEPPPPDKECIHQFIFHEGKILCNTCGPGDRSWIWIYDVVKREYSLRAATERRGLLLDGSLPESMVWKEHGGELWAGRLRPWLGLSSRQDYYMLKGAGTKPKELRFLAYRGSELSAGAHELLGCGQPARWLTALVPGTDWAVETVLDVEPCFRVWDLSVRKCTRLAGCWGTPEVSPPLGGSGAFFLMATRDHQENTWLDLCRPAPAARLDHAVIQGHVYDIERWGEDEVVLIGEKSYEENAPLCEWCVRYSAEPIPAILSVEEVESPDVDQYWNLLWRDGIHLWVAEGSSELKMRRSPLLELPGHEDKSPKEPFTVAMKTGDTTFRVWEVDFPWGRAMYEGKVVYDAEGDTLRVEVQDLAPAESPGHS